MNSIFTNALPGQNEDSHIYTLKERFYQDNEGNNENNIFIDDKKIKEIGQRKDDVIKKYKDYNNKIAMDYNLNSRILHHNRSRNIMRERSRDRESYREKGRDNQRSRSKKYSRSNSRNYRRSNSRINDYRKKRSENEREKNSGRYYQRPYSFFSYIENGVTKISTYFTVPDHLVSLLIGKKGENIRAIMNSTGAVVTFCKEVRI